MNRKDYELYKWYQLTDDEYWISTNIIKIGNKKNKK